MRGGGRRATRAIAPHHAHLPSAVRCAARRAAPVVGGLPLRRAGDVRRRVAQVTGIAYATFAGDSARGPRRHASMNRRCPVRRACAAVACSRLLSALSRAAAHFRVLPTRRAAALLADVVARLFSRVCRFWGVAAVGARSGVGRVSLALCRFAAVFGCVFACFPS
jgi:hypothetical protein